jgi:hypothetical protein
VSKFANLSSHFSRVACVVKAFSLSGSAEFGAERSRSRGECDLNESESGRVGAGERKLQETRSSARTSGSGIRPTPAAKAGPERSRAAATYVSPGRKPWVSKKGRNKSRRTALLLRRSLSAEETPRPQPPRPPEVPQRCTCSLRSMIATAPVPRSTRTRGTEL